MEYYGMKNISDYLVLDVDGRCSGNLKMDESCLTINNGMNTSLEIYSQTCECYKCPLLYSGVLPVKNSTFIADSRYPLKILINGLDKDCSTVFTFNEYSHYAWNISNEKCSEIYLTWKPYIAYQSLLIWFVVLFTALALLCGLKSFLNSNFYKRLRHREVPFTEIENDLGSPSSDVAQLVKSELIPVKRHKSRMVSVDIFRGLSISLMIFVNYGGGKYTFFKHSPWNGLTVADLVFPWFIWIMGFSISISLRSQLRNAISRWQLFKKVFWRSIVLILLGVIMNTKGDHSVQLSEIRLPGVLQRIGVSYFIVGTLETAFMKRQAFFEYGPWLTLQDIMESWLQWLIVLGFTAAHTLLTFLLHVPGCPTGYLGPGGLSVEDQRNTSFNCTGGAAGYIDRLIFTENHLYKNPTCSAIYKSAVPYDPEGLLGVLNSVLITYLGVQAGRITLCFNFPSSRIIRWLLWSVITGLIAGGLCGFSKEEGVIPVNKNLWSLSYVLATGSFAYMLFSIIYFVTDVKHLWSGSPLYHAGMNALFLYVGHELTRNMFPWTWKPFFGTHAEYLVMDLWSTILWLLIAIVMYKKEIFITV